MVASLEPDCPALGGRFDPAFEGLAREFERNFAERDELGASLCVIQNGRTVVDLWGGYQDEARARPWTEDTLVMVFSCTKAAVALCVHMLANGREIDLDDPLSKYWPAFASLGRREISLRMVLNHQAGLPGVSQPVDAADLYDFRTMVARMETEPPMWKPGTRHGYHAATQGWLLGGLIDRVTGQTPGEYFAQRVARPFGVDLFIGLPEAEEHRVADVVRTGLSVALTPTVAAAAARAEPIQTAVVNSLGALLDARACNERASRAAEVPATNGMSGARGLARMYSALVCEPTGQAPPVGDAQLMQMIATESSSACDAVLLGPTRFSAGFEKGAPGRSAMVAGAGLVLSEAAFGFSGRGGSVGFGDPVERLAFGYVLNRHTEAETDKSQPLIDATYRTLGYHTRESGKWIPPRRHPTGSRRAVKGS